MKTKLGLALCLLLIMLCVFAFADVPIDEDHFPDESFRTIISYKDWSRDGVLNNDEINDITELDVSKQGIQSLNGIEYLTKLTSLNCSSNSLYQLDVRKNTALTKLDCSYNYIGKLNISKNKKLIELDCGWNLISNLNVSKNTKLTSLSCWHNQLSILDVSKNTKLTYLHCGDNKLSTLDVSKNIKLNKLNCCYNNLKKLDVKKNSELVSLLCHQNQLTKLDVSKNTQLSYLYCVGNKISTLVINNNANLYWLECYYNKLTAVDISHCPILVDLIKTATVIQNTNNAIFYTNDEYTRSLSIDDSCKLILKPIKSIKLNKTTATLKVGKSLKLKVKKITPSDATFKELKWTSSNKKVATVDKNGKVKAIGKGSCIITCGAKDGSGKKVTCKITVQ